MQVTLTDSNVEVVWQSALAITDTAVKFLSADIDVSGCTDFYFIVESSLDQVVNFSLHKLNSHGFSGFESSDQTGAKHKITVPAGNTTKQQVVWKPTNINFAVKLNGFLVCTTAPTLGSVTVYVVKRGKI